MLAVLKKDIKKYYTSVFTYLYYMIFFLTEGIFFSSRCLTDYDTQFGYYVLSNAGYITLFIIPIFAMQMFAGERQRRTDRLLFTSPISFYSIIAAKYLSVMCVVLCPVVLSIAFPILISNYGHVNVSFTVCAFAAVILTAAAVTAIGMFLSSIMGNSILAAVSLYVIYAVILLLKIAEPMLGQGKLYYFIQGISIYNIYNDMVSGIIRSGNIAFLIILIVLFYNLSWIVISINRVKLKYRRFIAFGLPVLSLLLAVVFINKSVTYDLTPEKILTISDETKDILKKIEKETKIYCIGKISNVNSAYVEFLKLYKAQNDNIEIEYVDFDENDSLKNQFLGDIPLINEGSMLVVCEDSYIYIDSEDYISSIQKSKYETESLLEIENLLTEAVYYTNESEKEKICILADNGESQLTAHFYYKILQNGYEIENLYLRERLKNIGSVINEKCEMIIINSPEVDYSDDEIKALTDYVEAGGRIAVFLDPLNEDLTNLYSFLKNCGLDVVSGVVIEKNENMYAYETPYYLIPEMKKHDITESLINNNLSVLTMTSKGILIDETDDTLINDILLTSRLAFSKLSDYDNITTKGDGDVSGPFSVASIADKGKGEILLVTSNMFLSDDVDRETLGANRKFLLNSINYMTGKESGLNLTAKNVPNDTALFSRSEIKLFKLIFIIIVPLLAILSGIVIVIVRKNNILVTKKLKKNINEKTVENDATEKNKGKEQI